MGLAALQLSELSPFLMRESSTLALSRTGEGRLHLEDEVKHVRQERSRNKNDRCSHWLEYCRSRGFKNLHFIFCLKSHSNTLPMWSLCLKNKRAPQVNRSAQRLAYSWFLKNCLGYLRLVSTCACQSSAFQFLSNSSPNSVPRLPQSSL